MRWLLLVLIGCDADAPAPVSAPDPSTVRQALIAAHPEPLIELVDDTRAVIGAEDGCPSLEVEDGQERWVGGCTLSDGTAVEGTLVRYDGPEGTWVASEGFALREGGELLFYLDGAIEIYGEGDLLQMDAAASLCGVGLSCVDGPLTVDLSYSLYPLVQYPTSYDATVTGVVLGEQGGPISVDGAWSVNDATCSDEPASGIFAIRQREQHALILDGDRACDGCAGWSVQGLGVGRYCGLDL